MITDLHDADPGTCGGKAGVLGRLLRAGLAVPDGFILPFEAHSMGEPVPIEALRAGLRAMGDPTVAVRSSASDEDTLGASAAGQYDSFLGVRGAEEVAQAALSCWASLETTRVAVYRRDADVGMAVLIQRLVDADVSGVMFTSAAADGATSIEGSWGLGLSVVGGSVSPDAYAVAADGSVTSQIADKSTRLDHVGNEIVVREVPDADRRRPCLADDALARLTALGHAVAEILGRPQDIEWAISDEQIWILQARPITVAPPGRGGQVGDTTGLLTGVPGSSGAAPGIARIIAGPGDFGRVQPGDILICPYTDPAWTPLLRVAAGVVTQTGGVLSHAAIIAREYGIPAVLAVPQAMSLISDGARVTIDGNKGTIRMEERS